MNMKKYFKVKGEIRLIAKIKPGSSIKYYLPLEDVFDIIQAVHIATGHGGRDRLLKETSIKYSNFTSELIELYLKMYEVCHQEKIKRRRGLVSKPIFHSEMNSRCQLDQPLIPPLQDLSLNIVARFPPSLQSWEAFAQDYEDPDRYLSKFQEYVTALQIPDGNRLVVLEKGLKGTAESWWLCYKPMKLFFERFSELLRVQFDSQSIKNALAVKL
uniref:Integrase zinc-binding domain-containing protein n=1 Tax=Trichogramma kaykai TaxID=54128 RepID=A0ABD2WY44_9HYME